MPNQFNTFDFFFQLKEEKDDLHSSVFHATLNHWYSLNKSADFNVAVKPLSKHITLPQVEMNLTMAVRQQRAQINNPTNEKITNYYIICINGLGQYYY